MEYIKYIWPLIVLQLGLVIAALVDIYRKKKTKNLSPVIWAVIVIFGNILGPIAYFLLGKADEE